MKNRSLKFSLLLLVSLVSAHLFAQTADFVVKPSFPEGKAKLGNLLRTKLQLQANNLQIIQLQFEVDEAGNLGDIELIGTKENLEKKALKYLESLKVWNPGKINGVPTAMTDTLTLVFGVKPSTDTLVEKTKRRVLSKEEAGQYLTLADMQDNNVFAFTDEQMPTFPGGIPNLMRFVGSNLRYPSSEADKKVEGRVIIGFVVGEDGTIRDIELVKSLSKACDEEAMRVVKMMPKWIPGTQNGEPVAVYFSLPILYKLQGERVKPPTRNPKSHYDRQKSNRW